MSLEAKLRLYLDMDFQQRITYKQNYRVAVEHFRAEHGMRSGLTERYALKWLLDYMVKELHYTPIPPISQPGDSNSYHP